MLKKNRNRNVSNRGTGLLLLVFIFAMLINVAFAAESDKKSKNVKSKVKTSLVKSKDSSLTQSQRLIVRFKQGVLGSAKSSLHQTLGSRVKKSIKSVPGLQVIEVGPGQDVDSILKQYRKDPSVKYAEKDSKIKLRAIPNDSQFSQLWGMNNTGQTGGSADADINAPQAWDITTGDENVVVAVIDTGVDYTHVDLVDNIWTNPIEAAGLPNVDDDGNGYIDDIYGIDPSDSDVDPMDFEGHGTHVAGTIGARGNNTMGVVGVNWNVKIIACKIFTDTTAQDIEAFVSDAVECLDYLRALKIDQGVNIVATNNSWGWIGPPSQTLIDAIDRQLDAGILFMAAAGNDSLNTDQFLDNPSGYYIPNVISVAASTDTDSLASFSNFGKRTVHVAAPGHEILSTIPGLGALPINPHSEAFIDTVEGGAGNWSAGGQWAISSIDSVSGSRSWTDSPVGNYLNNTDFSLESETIDLSSYSGQTVYLGFNINYEIEDFFDEMFFEISANNGATWTSLDSVTGQSNDWYFISLVIPQSHLVSTFRFRFRLETDSSITYDGVYIDDIGIGTSPVPSISSRYNTFSGTSMASPHVVGLAALIKASNAALTWDQIKNLIISSGTPRSAFANTVSGRRIRASDPGGRGALDCSDQTVLARLQPATDEYGLEPGDPVNISMLHINCDAPAGNVSVTISETGDTVELLDDGTGFDRVAGDGIYSAQIDLDVIGEEKITIEFPDSSTVYANTVYNYQPGVANTYQWRDISAIGVPLFTGNPSGEPYDDDTRYFNPPFAIPFGNTTAPYDRLAVDSNGYLVMQYLGSEAMQFSIFENFEIPMFGLSNMIAVFWDDLVIDNVSGSNVYWGVLGSAPNRELVITWQNVRAFSGSQGMTFQVVFNESSSDVIVNYQDTVTPDSFVNNGIGATSGVQVAPNIGTQFSYNTASLISGTSIRWSMPAGVVNNPTVPPPDPPVFRSSPGGGGGSFGMTLVLLIPLLLFTRFFGRAERKII